MSSGKMGAPDEALASHDRRGRIYRRRGPRLRSSVDYRPQPQPDAPRPAAGEDAAHDCVSARTVSYRARRAHRHRAAAAAAADRRLRVRDT